MSASGPESGPSGPLVFIWPLPLYSDAICHSDNCIKDGVVHCIFLGVTIRNIQIIMYFGPCKLYLS